jgi:hypothetical protein
LLAYDGNERSKRVYATPARIELIATLDGAMAEVSSPGGYSDP